MTTVRILVGTLCFISVQESEMISQVEAGISEISAVVQNNSLAAEKSSTVSEELSQQAEVLSSLISCFRIDS